MRTAVKRSRPQPALRTLAAVSAMSELSGRAATIAIRLTHTLRDMEIALDLGDIDLARTHLETLSVRVGDAVGELTA